MYALIKHAFPQQLVSERVVGWGRETLRERILKRQNDEEIKLRDNTRVVREIERQGDTRWTRKILVKRGRHTMRTVKTWQTNTDRVDVDRVRVWGKDGKHDEEESHQRGHPSTLTHMLLIYYFWLICFLYLSLSRYVNTSMDLFMCIDRVSHTFAICVFSILLSPRHIFSVMSWGWVWQSESDTGCGDNVVMIYDTGGEKEDTPEDDLGTDYCDQIERYWESVLAYICHRHSKTPTREMLVKIHGLELKERENLWEMSSADLLSLISFSKCICINLKLPCWSQFF